MDITISKPVRALVANVERGRSVLAVLPHKLSFPNGQELHIEKSQIDQETRSRVEYTFGGLSIGMEFWPNAFDDMDEGGQRDIGHIIVYLRDGEIEVWTKLAYYIVVVLRDDRLVAVRITDQTSKESWIWSERDEPLNELDTFVGTVMVEAHKRAQIRRLDMRTPILPQENQSDSR